MFLVGFKKWLVSITLKKMARTKTIINPIAHKGKKPSSMSEGVDDCVPGWGSCAGWSP
jgi:hypothetical protein